VGLKRFPAALLIRVQREVSDDKLDILVHNVFRESRQSRVTVEHFAAVQWWTFFASLSFLANEKQLLDRLFSSHQRIYGHVHTGSRNNTP